MYMDCGQRRHSSIDKVKGFVKNYCNDISSQFANKLTTLSDGKSASLTTFASVIGNYQSVTIAR